MRGKVWIGRRRTWVPIAIARKEGLMKKSFGYYPTRKAKGGKK